MLKTNVIGQQKATKTDISPIYAEVESSSWKYRCRLIVTSGFLLLLFAAGACAQSSSPPPAQQPQSEAGTAANDDPNKKSTQYENGLSTDRLFFALPNFLTLENAGQVPPLTAGQKFKATYQFSFDYVNYPWFGFLASISQAQNSEPGFGQGATGYAKRYGAAFADGTIENYFTSAILPSMLHQDPRYFQMDKGGFWRRTGYAFSRIYVTRTDSGKNQFNYSEVVGSAISSAISTYTYHPREDRTLTNTASVWGTQVAWDTMVIVMREFWPDIRRKIRKEKP